MHFALEFEITLNICRILNNTYRRSYVAGASAALAHVALALAGGCRLQDGPDDIAIFSVYRIRLLVQIIRVRSESPEGFSIFLCLIMAYDSYCHGMAQHKNYKS